MEGGYHSACFHSELLSGQCNIEGGWLCTFREHFHFKLSNFSLLSPYNNPAQKYNTFSLDH